MIRLFVYGTLKRGFPAQGLLGNSIYECDASLTGTLHDTGRFPALVLSGDGLVHGEVWGCDRETLERLDSYEGVSEGLFRRVRCLVRESPCWVYEAGQEIRSRLGSDSVIPSGRWTLNGPPEPNQADGGDGV